MGEGVRGEEGKEEGVEGRVREGWVGEGQVKGGREEEEEQGREAREEVKEDGCACMAS